MDIDQTKWWEKSVEYLYVINHLKDYSIVCPLDGDEEAISDLIASDEYNWIVIEFKKNASWELPEKNKFNKGLNVDQYKKAREFLCEKYEANEKDGLNHHYIVYGHPEDVGLTLRAERYFSTPQNEILNTDSLFENGLKFNDFKKYVCWFTAFKAGIKEPADPRFPNPKEPSGGPSPNDTSGGPSNGDSTSVIGIDSKGRSVIITGLNFIKKVRGKPESKINQDPNQKSQIKVKERPGKYGPKYSFNGDEIESSRKRKGSYKTFNND